MSQPTARLMGVRRRLRDALVVLLSPLLFLALLEAALRLFGFGYPAAFWASVEEQSAIQTNRYFGRRFFSPAVARTPEPVRLSIPKPAGVYRIFVVGGSAAMGFPEPGFSFGRILEILLEDRHPGTDFEVVNAAMTAINSHVVLPIVRDSARYEPDAFVAYLGNNEIVGPYGPGTVFTGAAPSLPLLRLTIALGGARTGQLLRSAIAATPLGWREPKSWRGMEMFTEHRIAVDDPRLDQAYESFQANLESIARAAQAAGALTILSTVAVNLRDCPPFASLPTREGADAKAVFSTATALWESGDHQEALRNFELARDLDALRFRADSRINALIREAAARLRSINVRLADAEAAFREASRGGAAGDEWFFEHVHFRFTGAWKLAETTASALEPLLPQAIQRTGGDGDWLDEERTAEQIAYTPWDRRRLEIQVRDLMRRPPFTMQEGHSVRLARSSTLIERLSMAADPERALPAYENALARRPDDLSIQRRYAELLAAAGKFESAAQIWKELLRQLPRRPSWLAAAGAALRAAGRPAEAIEQYEFALEEDPLFAEAEFGLGVALQGQGRLEEAVGRYERALRLDPLYAEAEDNLGLIRLQQGDREAARKAFVRAAELNPNFAPAPFHLGGLLASQGQLAEASLHFEEALRRRPEYAEACAGLAATFAAQKKFEKAVELYQQATEMNPLLAEAQFNLAKLYELRGDRPSAIERYRAALDAKPDYLEAMNNLGIALARSGLRREAEDLFRRALALDPGFDPARANLERLRTTHRD